MMYNSPSNPIIYKILRSCLLRDITMRETTYDYDQCIYFVQSDEGNSIVKFGFSSKCSKEIMTNGGKEMLNELYKEHLLPESENIPDFDITLGLD